MKRAWKILTMIALIGALSLACEYAYMEPQSWIGGIYLRSKYNPEDQDLKKIADYLRETNGGSIPESFDRHLFKRLDRAVPDSAEYRNILGFYASQSMSSKAGEMIFKEGKRFLPSIIRYGREATPKDAQPGYLFLAYGIASKKQAYKPSLFFTAVPQESIGLKGESGLALS